MHDALGIGQHVVSHAPAISPGCIVSVVEHVGTCVGNTLLAGVLPLEETVGGNAAVQNGRQLGKLQVLGVGNEATAVAPAQFSNGESHHVATLQLEALDAVLQLCVAEVLHEAARVSEVEVVGRLSLEVRFGVDGECPGCSVRQNQCTLIVDANLAVLIVAGCLAIDLDESQVGNGLSRFHLVEEHYCMVGVHNVNASRCCERITRRNVKVHVVSQSHWFRDLSHRPFCVGSRCHEHQPKKHLEK